ncbi:WD40-repeat-containing domain protein [Rhypophila decipiens]|uniref:ASTRA-associated protein 1 n=1 Tax=Rhypophila decipiens TaxID=261697 RepID=A0AAN6YFL7_9PEZI|nr:WD40-repeat-containing domain protein [Rhypophila decipiens]
MASEARPAQPKSILRGHKAQIHATAFIRRNERLVTGDADGFVVVWDLTIMRPRAVWRPHTNAILGISGWGPDKIITHGRDNKLIVWKLGVDDEARMSTALPLDPSTDSRQDPWMLYMLEVNTMNFCSFSSCPFLQGSGDAGSELLVAVPNTLASEAIDIYHLPSPARRYTVKLGDKNGMVMAVSISDHSSGTTLIAGYENGVVIAAHFTPETGAWTVEYRAQAHSQPILSLDISPSRDFFITSGADATIAKHPFPAQTISQRTDSGNSEAPPAAPNTNATNEAKGAKPRSLLAEALQNVPQPTTTPQARISPGTQVQTEPIKVVNTKHAGQQSLRIRSDGRVFATAGWDNKIRIYSTKTLKEVAVLKWHQAGCYAVAFAEIDPPPADGADKQSMPQDNASEKTQDAKSQDAKQEAGSLTVIPKVIEMTVREKRIKEVMSAHWLAAGSKDCKVSLWDVF